MTLKIQLHCEYSGAKEFYYTANFAKGVANSQSHLNDHGTIWEMAVVLLNTSHGEATLIQIGHRLSKWVIGRIWRKPLHSLSFTNAPRDILSLLAETTAHKPSAMQ